MIIGLRAGHSAKCGGANKYLNEYNQCSELFKYVRDLLKAQGHTVIDCNSTASTQSAELREGTDKANKNKCDIYITLHMNASGGAGYGTEVWTYNSTSTKANDIGKRLCANMAELGLRNRGLKHNQGYHDLKQTTMQAAIFELLFVDNQGDVDIWNKNSWDTIARKVANAIDPNIPKVKPAPPTPPVQTGQTFYRVIAGSYSQRANADKRKAELEAKGFTGVFLEAIKK